MSHCCDLVQKIVWIKWMRLTPSLQGNLQKVTFWHASWCHNFSHIVMLLQIGWECPPSCELLMRGHIYVWLSRSCQQLPYQALRGIWELLCQVDTILVVWVPQTLDLNETNTKYLNYKYNTSIHLWQMGIANLNCLIFYFLFFPFLDGLVANLKSHIKGAIQHSCWLHCALSETLANSPIFHLFFFNHFP